MKKIVLMMMSVGLVAGCYSDDQAVFDENVVTIQSIQTAGACTEAATLGGVAALSSYEGPQVTFNWNNIVSYDTNKTYESYIEIMEDTACPAPAGAAPVAATYPIDVFNTSSLLIPGVSSKCFFWRIVINGYVDSNLECNTTTEWQAATYVQ